MVDEPKSLLNIEVLKPEENFKSFRIIKKAENIDSQAFFYDSIGTELELFWKI